MGVEPRLGFHYLRATMVSRERVTWRKGYVYRSTAMIQYGDLPVAGAAGSTHRWSNGGIELDGSLCIWICFYQSHSRFTHQAVAAAYAARICRKVSALKLEIQSLLDDTIVLVWSTARTIALGDAGEGGSSLCAFHSNRQPNGVEWGGQFDEIRVGPTWFSVVLVSNTIIYSSGSKTIH